MNRRHVLTGIVALYAMMLVQTGMAQNQAPSPGTQPYEPAVPPPSMNFYGGAGGYGYNIGGTTPAGSAMNGMANAISAKGNYNLSTSAAAINMTQAQSNEMQNHQQYENTYFQMQQANQAYQKAHRPAPADGGTTGAPGPRRGAPTGQPERSQPGQRESQLARRAAGTQLRRGSHDDGAVVGKEGRPRLAQHLRRNGRSQDDRVDVCRVEDASQRSSRRRTTLTSRTFLRSMIYAIAHSDL